MLNYHGCKGVDINVIGATLFDRYYLQNENVITIWKTANNTKKE